MNADSKSIRCELISWRKTYALVRNVAAQIRAVRFQPDLIVAIARGGYVPARLLCDLLNVYELTSIRIAHYRAGSDKQPRAELVSPLAVDIHNRKVLLVDDVSDSGDTLQVAVAHLKGFYSAQLKIAVLHHKTVSPLTPDFYGQQVRTWRWIIYPWAAVEDLRGLLQRQTPYPSDRQTASQVLKRLYGLRVPPWILDEVMASR